MTIFTRKRAVVGVIIGVAGAAALATALSAGAAPPKPIDELRASTARFEAFDNAERAGYGLLTDAQGIACIDKPGTGAMGVHYVNGTYVNDPAELVRHPEALVYEPLANGIHRLVAVEYVVTKSAWEGAGHRAPPQLFGQDFTLVPAGNRYGLPDFYALHVWLYKTNPSGLFAMYNPNVTCANAPGVPVR